MPQLNLAGRRGVCTSAEPLLPRRLFLRRLALHGLAAAAVVAVSLSLGILGYHFLAGLPRIDALLHASMILTGAVLRSPV